MTTYYDQDFPVTKWIIGTDLNEKQQEVLNRIASKKAVFISWPALDLPAELQKMATEGYDEQINQKKPFFLDLVLVLRAMVNITRRYNPIAQLSNRPAYHHLCDNRIAEEGDFVRFGNEILRANDPITLSQVFDTAEKTLLTMFSFDADVKTVQKIAKTVVVLGNSDNCDVNLSNMNNKELQTAISSVF